MRKQSKVFFFYTGEVCFHCERSAAAIPYISLQANEEVDPCGRARVNKILKRKRKIHGYFNEKNDCTAQGNILSCLQPEEHDREEEEGIRRRDQTLKVIYLYSGNERLGNF